MNVPRKPPFALWVENVDPIRVDAKDLWEAFARYGDMCKPREHGARAVEIVPESKAAIVNFASYEHACAALKGLQGALIGKITRPGLSVSWQKRQEETPQARPPISPTKDIGGKDKDRPPFFGLWVGNVHASLVHEDEFKGAFEKYGDLCHPQVCLPDRSFVNRFHFATCCRLSYSLGRSAFPTSKPRFWEEFPHRIQNLSHLLTHKNNQRARGMSSRERLVILTRLVRFPGML